MSGVKSLCGKSRPGRLRNLVSDAPTWNKRSSELLVVTRGAFACSDEELDKHPLGKSSSARVVYIVKYLIEPCECPLECFAIFKVREHPKSVDASFLLARVVTRVRICLLGEGASETL